MVAETASDSQSSATNESPNSSASVTKSSASTNSANFALLTSYWSIAKLVIFTCLTGPSPSCGKCTRCFGVPM